MHGADFLLLDPAKAPSRGLTDWLTGELRAAIKDGRLAAGVALPATRVLARELGISRGVVVDAYRRLADEGLIDGRQGNGTRVLALGIPQSRDPAAGPSGVLPAQPPAAGAPVAPVTLDWPSVVLPARWGAKAEIDLSPGVPDLSGFPRAAWLRAEKAVLSGAGTADLSYPDPRGNPRLREALAGWLARRRGVRAGPDDILVVAGVAQSLALLAQVLLREREGGRVGVEDPGPRGSRDELVHWGLRPVPVPVDDEGVRVAELDRTGAGIVLLTPAHQFPTGVVLAAQRRRELLRWAAAGERLIIEDDYDAEYRYDRPPVPALQGAARDLVAYTGSTSKTLAPGMRLGWLVPPQRLHADLVAAKHASDLGCPVLPQLVLAHLMASGELERHIRVVRGRQRVRRDALLAGLREHLPQARVSGVAAGLHLLITLPGDADDAELAARILQAGVLVHPLSLHRVRPGPPGLILGYAAHTPGQLREAAQRIATALASGTPARAGRRTTPGRRAAPAGKAR